MHKRVEAKQADAPRVPSRPAPAPDAPSAHVLQRVVGNQAVLRRRSGAVTGLPGGLRGDLERRGGVSLGDVRVHHDSPEPSRYDALAFTRGREIHLGVGQSRHLEHEAWHAVQQQQGRVRATTTIAGAPLSDDPGLEHEADTGGRDAPRHERRHSAPPVLQRVQADRDADHHWISDLNQGAVLAPGDGYIRVTSFASAADTWTGAVGNKDHAYVGIEYVDSHDDPHTVFTDLTHDGVRFSDDESTYTGGLKFDDEGGKTAHKAIADKLVNTDYVGTSYRITAPQAVAAIDRAREILHEYKGKRPPRGSDPKYKFARSGHTLSRDHGINCARFAQKVLKAAGIETSAGKLAKTPYEAANLSGGASGHKVIDATQPDELDASALTKALRSMATVSGGGDKMTASIASRLRKQELPPEHLVAITDWVKGGWSALNSYVRGILSAADQKSLEEIVANGKKALTFEERLNALNATLDRLDTVTTTSYRYSGVASDDVYTKLIVPGDYISDRGFVASSMIKGGEAAASSWGKRAGAYFEIHGTSGRDISQHSPLPGEREILFKPNAVFKVDAIRTEGSIAWVIVHEVAGSGSKPIKNSFSGAVFT